VVGSIDGWMEGVRTEVWKEGRAVGRGGRQAYLGKQRNSDSHFFRIQIRRQLIEVYLGLPQIFNTNFKTVLHINGGTRWRSWLRHCATSRKVAGLILDGLIGIFHSHNPSDRTMALGSTQPLTEISTRNVSWG